MQSKLSGVRGVLLMALWLLPWAAHALDYVSVADKTAILYDANSTKAKKLYVISRYMPLEVVVNLQHWIKVRDSAGVLAWIERRAVSDKHYVVVTANLAKVLQAPEANASVVLQVSKGVAMEAVGINGGGWIKVPVQNGNFGYMRSLDVWGAD